MIYRRLFDYPGMRLRTPFDELERMRREMERWYDGWSGRPYGAARAGVFPLVNLTETKDAYFIRAELPGLKGEDLDIQATGKSIAISGERKIAPEDESARYHRRERQGGTFSRMITLPGDVDSGKVSANLINGVLTVTVPKAEAAKPRQIQVS